MESEQPIRLVRQHPFVLVPYLLLLLLCGPIAMGMISAQLAMAGVAVIALAAALYHANGRHVLRWVVLGMLMLAGALLASLLVPATLILAAFAAVALGLRGLDWYFRIYTLTDRRVVTQRGVLNRVGETYWLSRIQHVRVRMNPINRFAGFGDVEIWVSGRGHEQLRQIVDAEEFHAQLLSAMEAKGGGRGRWQVPVPDYTPGPVRD
jgi:uncharacterized membrane protein YdbT with pleckstrin-like domain